MNFKNCSQILKIFAVSKNVRECKHVAKFEKRFQISKKCSQISEQFHVYRHHPRLAVVELSCVCHQVENSVVVRGEPGVGDEQGRVQGVADVAGR